MKIATVLAAAAVALLCLTGCLDETADTSTNHTVLARAEASTVKVFNDQGLGTGVIVGKNRVVTAAHVVGPNATMSILLPNGDVKPGKVLWTGKAPKEDVALIEVDTGRNRVAYLNCNQVKSGDTVYAYGFPLGIRRVFVKGMVAGNDALKD